jgi:hypothetical protein
MGPMDGAGVNKNREGLIFPGCDNVLSGYLLLENQVEMDFQGVI